MKILFILPELPFPLSTGVRVKCHAILLAASMRNHCDVVSLGGESVEEAKKVLAEFVPRARLLRTFQPYKGFRLLLAKVCAFFFKEPIFFARYYNKRVFETVGVISNEGYDLVFLESFALARYVSSVENAPCVISITDPLSLTYRHAADQSNNLFFSLYRLHQLGVVRRAESSLLHKFSAVHIVSESDRDYLGKQYPQVEAFAIPHTVPEKVRQNLRDSTNLVKVNRGYLRILYSGRCTSDTALNTLLDFVKNVFIPLRDSGLNIQLTILPGGGAKIVEKTLPDLDSIEVKDWVENYELELLESDVLVFPDKFHMGVKTRVLYAFAAGKAIVATQDAVFGLPVIDGEHLLIREIGAEFAAALRTLVHNESLRRQFGLNALRLLDEKLSTDAHNIKWNSIFDQYGS